MFLKKIINKSINKGYDASQCGLCHIQFNPLIFDRIHRCKRCFKYVCYACSNRKQFIIDEEGNLSEEKHRVCKKCKYDIDLINETIAKYEMGQKQQSFQAMAQKYVQSGLLSARIYSKDYEYEHFINYFHKSGSIFDDEIQIIEKDVIRGRTDFSVFNYSMKEFFYTIQQGVQDQHTTRLNIANVLYGVAARFEKVGYCQGMSGIAAFLLCFAEERSSYVIFCDLIENILPFQFFQRNSYGVPLIGLMAQIYFLKEYYWIFMQKKKNLILKQRQVWYNQDEIDHTKMIIELAGMKALLSIFIGVLSFTNTIFVWQEIKSNRNFQVVEKAFLAIIYLNRENILQERSFKNLELYFEQLDQYFFQQTYHDITIDPKVKKELIDKFYQDNNKKCGTSKTGNAYTMSKVTNFSQEEIKFMQKTLCQGFSNEDYPTKSMIHEEEFIKLVEVYYKVLKKNSQQGEQILELTPPMIQKIFQSYQTTPQNGLLFRQFIGCFSICTKNQLKGKICAIVMAYEGSNQISIQNLYKIMAILMQKVPKRLQTQKISFMARMKNFYSKSKFITALDLNTLLNDLFINQMDLYIVSDCQGIIQNVIQEFKELKLSKEVKKDERQEQKIKIKGLE